MDKKIITQQIFKVNDQEYSNFEDLPDQFKQMLDKDGNGKADLIEKAHADILKDGFTSSHTTPQVVRVSNSNPSINDDPKEKLKNALVGGLILIGIYVLLKYVFAM